MALPHGKKAPAFKALKHPKGTWLVLYFYPKDDTSGCTAEACDFRDSMQRLTSAGAAVIGVSPDSDRSHAKFTEKYDLNFTLVADEDKAICEAFDVWKEKSMYGRKYMGVERTTYLIDPKGTIVHTWEKVKVKGHVDDVLATLLSASGAA